MRTIYLDYNATTPIAPAVQEAMLPALAEYFGNPSSDHRLGHTAREAVEDARSRVAGLLGCNSDEVIFTSGGTESNNLALKGTLARPGADPGHLIISAIEHPATIQPARYLERLGHEVTVVGCNSNGVVDPDEIQQALRPNTRLVSIMHANNEVGTIQPIAEIAKICRAAGVLSHTDAAQSTGKISTNVEELGVDMLTIAGHKVYAPKGVGALYIRRGVELEPLLHGADHEGGRRAGTENVPYLVGLGRAAEMAAKAPDDLEERITTLRHRLQAALNDGVEGLTVNGRSVARLPNTLSANFPGVNGAKLLAKCDELCASTGAACHSGASSLSATLAAMGMDEATAQSTVRLSLGWFSTEEEVDYAASLLIENWLRLR